MAYRKLGRDMEHRLAMLRNMVTSLIYHERITTTVAKAKTLRVMADNMVTYAKGGTQHDFRLAARYVREKGAMAKLFHILGPRYQNRPGGYTRILKIGKPRRGDSAELAVIEYIDREGELRKPKSCPVNVDQIVKDSLSN